MELTGQFTDKSTRNQSDWTIRGLLNSPKCLDAKFGVKNSDQCDIYKFAGGELTRRESSSPRIIHSKS